MNSKLLLIALLSLNSVFIVNGSDKEGEIRCSLSRTTSQEKVSKILKAQTPISQQPSQDKISMGSQAEREKTETSCLAACWSMFCK